MIKKIKIVMLTTIFLLITVQIALCEDGFSTRMPDTGKPFLNGRYWKKLPDIRQNDVYISFPITNDEKSSFKTNDCKVEAENNKLNIRPGESVSLFVFIPKENYEDNKYINSEKPSIEIKGYLNELKETNHFTRIGDMSMFVDE